MTGGSDACAKHEPVIGTDEASTLSALCLAAARNPFVMADIVAVPEAFQAYRLAAREQTISLPVGYTVTLTVENHNGTWFRHLSVAVDTPDALPSRAAAELIAHRCGFLGNAGHWLVHVEQLVAPDHAALNILQQVADGQEIARPPASSLHS